MYKRQIVIIVITCVIYTYSLLHGFKGISVLANACIYLFFGLLIYVLLFGGQTKYIVETGFSALGRMIQNFFSLATATDPQRTTSFPQNWTIYYWAYWMVWCVAAPFFIGNISRGRTAVSYTHLVAVDLVLNNRLSLANKLLAVYPVSLLGYGKFAGTYSGLGNATADNGYVLLLSLIHI